MHRRTALLAGLSLAAAQNNTSSSGGEVQCYDGAYIIVARASGEPEGFGILATVKDDVLEQIPNSEAIAVQYPASIFPPAPVYTESQPNGVGNMTELIKAYGDGCPDGKMVLMGYSQGAHVVSDVLVGASYANNGAFPETQPLESEYLEKIFAIIQMGDPSFTLDQSFDVGNATMGGLFQRDNVQNFQNEGLADKIQSYCDFNDTYCDQGDSLEVHIGYVQEYGEQASQFVVEKWNALDGGSAGNGTSGNSTTGGSASETGSGSAPTSTDSGSSDEDSSQEPSTTDSESSAAQPTGAAGTLTPSVLSGVVGLALAALFL